MTGILISDREEETQMNIFIKQKQTHRHRKKKIYGYQSGNVEWESDKSEVWD